MNTIVLKSSKRAEPGAEWNPDSSGACTVSRNPIPEPHASACAVKHVLFVSRWFKFPGAMPTLAWACLSSVFPRRFPTRRDSIPPAARGSLLIILIVMIFSSNTYADQKTDYRNSQRVTQKSITDTSIHLPTWSELFRVLSLRDYNTRVVLLGTTVLGLTAGIIGTFMLLRRRALMGDALSHATLPGIGIAFMIMVSMGGSGKYLPGLLLGAAISGAAGVGCVLLIRHFTRLKEDAALGIVLSVFFGLGISIFGIIQNMKTGQAAGLESFIYGKTASMLASDARLITYTAIIIAIGCIILFKEFNLLCFDQAYAEAQGWPILWLDVAMLTLVVFVTVIGLQAVGLILMIALLVIPPAAARFWTNHLPTMLFTSACIGALSGLLGAGISALIPRLPAGAIIVVVAGSIFAFSMIFGSARGVLVRWLDQRRIQLKVIHQHLLRAMFERCEQVPSDLKAIPNGVGFQNLMTARSWTPLVLRRQLARSMRANQIRQDTKGDYCLTESGWIEARRVVRNHRLWELYLITHADIAPSHVDRDADQLEHVLGKTMVEKLEEMLAAQQPQLAMPPSPHQLDHG